MLKRLLSWRVALGVMLGLYLGWYAGGKVAEAQSQTDPLVGKWAIEVTPEDASKQDGARQFKDVLTFKLSNEFISDEFKKKGFEEGKYDTDQRRYGPAKFNAEFASKNEGKAKWDGIATGQNVEGTLVWTKKDGSVLTYNFKGERTETPKKR